MNISIKIIISIEKEKGFHVGRTELIKTWTVLEVVHVSGGLILVWPKRMIYVGKFVGNRTRNVG